MDRSVLRKFNGVAKTSSLLNSDVISGLMAKNCCSIDMKSIWLRQLTHTIVEAFQQWWCFDEEKSVVQIAAAHELGGMEEALKGGNAFAVVHAVAVFSGRTESTSICENVFGLSAGLLRVTR